MVVRPLSRQEVRNIDVIAASQFNIPGWVLMENAGRGAACLLRQRLSLGRVSIFCGPGNNGGDGAVVARHLDSWGFDVDVVWLAERNQIIHDPDIQLQILEKSEIPQSFWSSIPDLEHLQTTFWRADWVVDGLLGTGLTRPVEGLLASVIEMLNRSGKPILALDIPSGLDADTGQVCGTAVRASATATFVGPKLGFSRARAHEYTGEVTVVDIGVPRRLLQPFLIN